MKTIHHDSNNKVIFNAKLTQKTKKRFNDLNQAPH